MPDILDHLWTHYHYVIYIALMVIGLYAVLAKGNLVKKVIGLNLLQTAVFLFYLSIGRVAAFPIRNDGIRRRPVLRGRSVSCQLV